MLSWITSKLVSRMMAGLRRGDTSLVLRLDADDVHLRFPGDSSWGGEFRGKAEHERWLRRFVEAGLQIFPDQVVAKGLPWRITLCVRGHIYLRDPEGETVYENRYVIWGLIRWGKLKEYEVFEDTQKTEALDRYLTGSQLSRSSA
jgi:ketosteroid isomerase-like protein